MDPNENLTTILRLAKSIIQESEEDERKNGHVVGQDESRSLMLAEYIVALDTWLTKGGFLPERWKP